MSGKLRILAMFIAMWFLFLGIAYVIIFAFGYQSYSLSFFIIICAVLILFNLVTYFFCDKMVLAAYRAKRVSEKEQPRLYNIIKDVAFKADLPMPRVAIIPTRNPNAFATGRDPDHAVVAVTEGILTTLNDEELEGVIAHEMAHVKDRDILIMSVASTVATVIAFAARMIWFQMFFGRSRNMNPLLLLVVAITAPIAAILIQLAISRSREYKADRVGAIMIQRPLALANALEKLERENRRTPMKLGSPASSSLFIVNPFRGGFASLFSTHPPMKERVRRLRELAREMGYL